MQLMKCSYFRSGSELWLGSSWDFRSDAEFRRECDGARGRRASSDEERELFSSLGFKSCRPSGFYNKMCGGIVGERTGLVKELDERTTLVWGSFYRCQAADCGLSSGGV